MALAGVDLVFEGGGAKGLAHVGAIREMENQGRIKIVGAVYDMESGAVHVLDD